MHKMKEMPKNYDAKTFEKKWLTIINQNSNKQSSNIYSILMPPPNVTGRLHLGHALGFTIQEIIARLKIMEGYKVIWHAGLDHAGIATQSVVERDLLKKHGKRRRDLSKKELQDYIEQWRIDHQEIIISQMRTLAPSADFSHILFTLDDLSTKHTYEVFKRLYDDGLIYRGEYLTNLDTALGSVISDEEVEYQEREGYLYYLKYMVKGEVIAVATRRPETIFGDVALAISPKDNRAYLHGELAEVPITKKKIPIIIDGHVDPSFGSGILKITPAHDFTDYDIGISHHLPFINIITNDGKLNEECGPLAGLSIEDGRREIVKMLEDHSLLIKVVKEKHKISLSQRSGAIVEPFLSKQWFLKSSHFKSDLIKVLEDIEIYPSHWKNSYLYWVNNLKEWCISRQLSWGHRIPIWYQGDKVVCSLNSPGEGYKQDADVLDTWFTSSIWPLITLDWAKSSPPMALLVTGFDILFFWVIRMIMMGIYLGYLPFKKVFLHGLIYAKSYWRTTNGEISFLSPKERMNIEMSSSIPKGIHHKWEKMSKSKGNVIDPMVIINDYGIDALRYGLCYNMGTAREISLDFKLFNEAKAFLNKLWNGVRFVVSTLPLSNKTLEIKQDLLTPSDLWILDRLSIYSKDIYKRFMEKQISDATKQLHNFFWKDLCSTYLEATKPYTRQDGPLSDNKKRILVTTIITFIKMTHPIIPLITEEIFSIFKDLLKDYSHISILESQSCSVGPFPRVDPPSNQPAVKRFAIMLSIAKWTRNFLSEVGIKEKSRLHICGETSLVEGEEDTLKALSKGIGEIAYNKPGDLYQGTSSIDGVDLYIPISPQSHKSFQAKVEKELSQVRSEELLLTKKLQERQFIERAPKEIVTKHKQQLEICKKRQDYLLEKLDSIGKFS